MPKLHTHFQAQEVILIIWDQPLSRYIFGFALLQLGWPTSKGQAPETDPALGTLALSSTRGFASSPTPRSPSWFSPFFQPQPHATPHYLAFGSSPAQPSRRATQAAAGLLQRSQPTGPAQSQAQVCCSQWEAVQIHGTGQCE